MYFCGVPRGLHDFSDLKIFPINESDALTDFSIFVWLFGRFFVALGCFASLLFLEFCSNFVGV